MISTFGRAKALCPRRSAAEAALIVAAAVVVVAVMGGVHCAPLRPGDAAAAAVPEPAGGAAALYTSARSIRALAVGPNGQLWAATAGGVVEWADGAAPRRWTTADGLPSNDARGLASVEPDGSVLVREPSGSARIDATGSVTRLDDTVPSRDAGFDVENGALVRRASGWRFPLPPEAAGSSLIAFVVGRRTAFLATPLGLWRLPLKAGRGEGVKWLPVTLPTTSRASHVSALAVLSSDHDIFAAGLYGDGVYQLTGDGTWSRFSGEPEACRRVTALAKFPADGPLAVGTADDGVWDTGPSSSGSAVWKRRALPDALASTDVTALAGFHGALWAASFDHGLACIDSAGGVTTTPADQSAGDTTGSVPASLQPRALVVFRDRLLVRLADHSVRARDAEGGWSPAWDAKALSRPEVYALGVDAFGGRLLVGGWAGWAEWDGDSAWVQHWSDPELDGQVVTSVAAGPDGVVWIGTQKRGLLRWANGKYQSFQEPQGLTDDWVTSIAVSPTGRVLAGTYTGGLLEKREGRFAQIFRADAFAIRNITFDRDGCAISATPVGVYREQKDGVWNLIDGQATGGLEAQAVLPTPGGMWVGTHTGLAFVPLDPAPRRK